MKKILFIAVCINIYLFYYILFGKLNVFNYIQYKKEIASKNAELIKIIGERHSIEKIFSLLSQKDTDIDLLQELVRDVMHMAFTNEVIVIPNDEG